MKKVISAKRKNRGTNIMNVKGLKVSDIIDMDWDSLNKLSGKELKQLTSRLVSASNKRIKRLEQTKLGKSSFAYQSVEERGRKFSVRGKNTNQIKQEFKLASNFMKMKTSTVSGWKKYRSELEQRTASATSGESMDWSARTWSKYWKVVRRFDETHRGTYKKGDSDRIQRMIREIMESSDKRKSADSFQRMIEDEYESMYESDESDYDDFDDYFEY